MLAKQLSRPLRPIMVPAALYVANLTLKSQTQGSASMTPFYIVTIVFTVLIVAAVISVFISKKKNK